MALQAAFAALAILIHQLNRFCPENIYDLPSQAFDDHSIFWPVRLGISSAMVPSEGIVDRCIIFMIFVLVSVHHPSRKILRQLPRHWACVFLSTQKICTFASCLLLRGRRECIPRFLRLANRAGVSYPALPNFSIWIF